jgi:hypothetical protein
VPPRDGLRRRRTTAGVVLVDILVSVLIIGISVGSAIAFMASTNGVAEVKLVHPWSTTGFYLLPDFGYLDGIGNYRGPAFQAAIFFEHDIELNPGAPMIIKGLVHSNNSLWLAAASANNLQFLTNVSYVDQSHETYNPVLTFGGGATPPPVQNPPVWADGLPFSSSTTVAGQLGQTSRMESFGTEPAHLFNTTDSNPNNNGPREVIEAPDPEIGFDYLQFGRPFCRSILFINLDASRQIHFIVDAGPAEFQPLYKTAYRTLATWYQPPSGTPGG